MSDEMSAVSHISLQAASGDRAVFDLRGERVGVSQIQRIRLVDAVAEVACEHGGGNLTVARIVARSGMSRRTFYELFSDADDCLVAAFEEGLQRAWARIEPAYRSRGRWRDRMRASLLALLRFLDDEPAFGRLLVVETLTAGASALKLRSRVVDHLVEAVREGLGESKVAASASSLVAEGTVGAVLAVVQARILAEQRQPLVGLLNELMAIVVLPYLGAAAARRELARPQPAPEPSSGVVSARALAELQMRLTYRTVRVLSAIASDPGCSNRRVADIADISDAGQASKLLARLEHLGLIERVKVERLRNSWRLTQKGQQVERALAVGSSPS